MTPTKVILTVLALLLAAVAALIEVVDAPLSTCYWKWRTKDVASKQTKIGEIQQMLGNQYETVQSTSGSRLVYQRLLITIYVELDHSGNVIEIYFDSD